MPDTPERLPQGTPEEIDEAISLIGRLSRSSKVRSVARDLLRGKKPDSILPLTASLLPSRGKAEQAQALRAGDEGLRGGGRKMRG